MVLGKGGYQIFRISELNLNTFIKQLFTDQNVFADIEADGIHNPINQQVIDYCRILKFRYQLLVYRQNFYTSLTLGTVLACPTLLQNLNAEVKFVDLSTFNEKTNDPSHGITDQNLYIASLRSYPDNRSLNQLFGPLLRNRNLRSNELKQFIEAAVRSGMGDIRETSTYFFKLSNTHKDLSQSKLFTFQAILRNAFIHNYTFNMKPHYLNKLPITWRGYTIDSSLNNQPISGYHFPVPEFIALTDDIVELVNENIRLFPQIELVSAYIT